MSLVALAWLGCFFALLLAATPVSADDSVVRVFMKPLSQLSTSSELVLFNTLANKFHADTGVKIVLEFDSNSGADPNDYYEVLNRYIQSQEPYDIVAIDESWTKQWPDSFLDLLLDRPGSAETAELIAARINDMDQTFNQNDASSSSIVAMPMWADYSVIYARADLLLKYNITVNSMVEMRNACDLIIPREKPTHQSLQCYVSGMDGTHIVEIFHEWISTSLNAPLLKIPETVAFNTEDNAALLSTYAGWVRDSDNPFIAPQSLGFDSDQALQVFTQGDALFFRGRMSSAASIFVNFASKPFDPVIISGNFNNPAVKMKSTPGGYHLAMTKYGQNLNDTAVALALLFLTSDQVQRPRALQFGAIPTLKSLRNDPEVCSVVNCTTVQAQVLANLPLVAAGPYWVQAAQAMAPYFTGIINGTYAAAPGLLLASVAVQQAFRDAATKAAGSGGLSLTAVILLSVLIPIAAVALLVGAYLWWRRRRAHRASLKAREEEFTVASGPAATGLEPGTATPPMYERKELGLVNLSIRPARRPDASNAADLQRVVGTGAGSSIKGGGASSSQAGGAAATTDVAGESAAGGANSTMLASAANSQDDPTSRERGSSETPGDINMLHRSPRSRTSSGDYANLTQRFTVIHAYKPAVGDELEIRPGDVVSVRLAYDDGYAFGYNEQTSTAGVFPLACLLPVGMEVGLPSRLESGAVNLHAMQHASEKVDSLEMLLLSGRITEATYLSLRREQEEELRTQRQITALRERLAGSSLSEEERRKLQNRLDELELGI
ncbi:hypothetical protein BDZ88DRAFT_454378 [Geranomyces variabilis]|nr:hypothetical protein BDZ88DRAFT_454378 [Geranomyces variabilis]KAJ3141525.1 hypothetical protein HDU90_005866 [Geranomyces variabilis]